MAYPIKVKNTDGDFFMSQNYILQLVSEKRITHSSFILYCFYRSLSGFDEIKCSYEWISINSGLSKGSITNGNYQLKDVGLINVINNGANRVYEIELIPGNQLPRRQLKKIEKITDTTEKHDVKIEGSEEESSSSADEHIVQQLNTEVRSSSAAELIQTESIDTKPKYNTTAARNAIRNVADLQPYLDFIQKFTDHWTSMYDQSIYPKQDYGALQEIKDPIEAIRYIPVLWSLNEIDKWVRDSDHSITIFVKEYLSGKLQSYYPNTKYFYKDKIDGN